MMLSKLSNCLHKAARFPDLALEKLRPLKPYDFLRAQPTSFADVLPYEGFLDLERPTCLLSDGALGIVWELTPLPHEVMEQAEMTRAVETVAWRTSIITPSDDN